MDEDISIISSNTRNEKIKNFFSNNKKTLILILSSVIIIILAYFSYDELKSKKIKNLANKYNDIILKFDTSNKESIKNQLVEIINEKDRTYSPLALYFIIDNNIQASNEEINKFFNILINDTNLDEEIKNLVIYKKALFNSDFETENNLIEILKPIINSKSVWKSHALYLMAEYFYHNNQNEKAKEFYYQILNYEKSNEKISLEAQKRLSRDLSE